MITVLLLAGGVWVLVAFGTAFVIGRAIRVANIPGDYWTTQ